MAIDIENKRILVTGGTGSLGQFLVARLLSGKHGRPQQVIIFSRDEARQHHMRQRFEQVGASTDETIYHSWHHTLTFRIGDVRNIDSVRTVIQDVDIVVNAAAMKQVPTCEYFPTEAYSTNVQGAANIAAAVGSVSNPPEVVIGVSTDKAVKPVNVMGMTKALQERVFIKANLDCPSTRFVLVRYGNVLASRGSVVPLFLQQIEHGGAVTITDSGMTRFLVSIDEAVDAVVAAIECARPGEILIPRSRSALMTDLARVLAKDEAFPIRVTGIRPGEKLHEILVSEEERRRTLHRGEYFVIRPMLPEFGKTEASEHTGLGREYSSAHEVMSYQDVQQLVNRLGYTSLAACSEFASQ